MILFGNQALALPPDTTVKAGTTRPRTTHETVQLHSSVAASSRFGDTPVVVTGVVVLPSDTALNRYRTTAEFQYDQAPEDETTLWDRFLEWLASLFPEREPPDLSDTDLNIETPRPNNLGWIWYVLIGLAIALIVLLFLRTKGMFTGKGAKALQFTEETEDIHAMDFPTLLQQALAELDYRRAIRIRFLETLKALEDAGSIAWRPEKTNRDYVYEIKHPDSRIWYREAMLVFDYTWYGHYNAEESHYKRLNYLARNIEIVAQGRKASAVPQPITPTLAQ